MKEYETLRLRLVGAAPLIINNGQLSDPLNYWSKKLREVTSKRSKTEADHEEIAKIEFLGSLYWNAELGPYLPSFMIERVILDGAKKLKRGPAVKAGVICEADAPLEFEGPREPEAMWIDGRFRFVISARPPSLSGRVQRSRPMFKQWAATIEVLYMSDIINRRDLLAAVEIAGHQSGLGNWRPRYGRFNIEEASELAVAAE